MFRKKICIYIFVNKTFTADKSSLVVISFPFRQCGMEVTLYENVVVYSNAIFMDTESGKAEKYAEFQCQYGADADIGIALERK